MQAANSFNPAAIMRLHFEKPASKIVSPSYQQMLDWFPYVGLCVALALCAYYNCSRGFTIVLALLAVYVIIQHKLQVALVEAETLVIFSMISISLPAIILLLMFLPECGLHNRYGLLAVSLVPIAVMACTLLLSAVTYNQAC